MQILHELIVVAALGIAFQAEAADGLRETFSGSEVRRTVGFGNPMRFDVLRLHPDGRVSGNFYVETSLGPKAGRPIEGDVAGRWSVENGALCLEGTGFEFRGRRCFNVARTGGSALSEIYAATPQGPGEGWTMFVSR